MQITWWLFPITFIFSDTICAVRPLIPASISSKISVPMESFWASTAFIASMILESSPPEATFESGFNGSPGLVEIKNSASSMPFAFGFSASLNSMVKRTSRKFRSISAFCTSSVSFFAYFFRIFDTFAQSA